MEIPQNVLKSKFQSRIAAIEKTSGAKSLEMVIVLASVVSSGLTQEYQLQCLNTARSLFAEVRDILSKASPPVLYALAKWLAREKRFTEAIDLCEQAFKLETLSHAGSAIRSEAEEDDRESAFYFLLHYQRQPQSRKLEQLLLLAEVSLRYPQIDSVHRYDVATLLLSCGEEQKALALFQSMAAEYAQHACGCSYCR